jgi:hypothetical protein
MVWQNLKHGGCEGEEKIEIFKLPKRFKLLVTHSIGITDETVANEHNHERDDANEVQHTNPSLMLLPNAIAAKPTRERQQHEY